MQTCILIYEPAALLKPASDVVPHVVRLKRIKQQIGCFNQFRRLLVLPQFTEKEGKISSVQLQQDNTAHQC